MITPAQCRAARALLGWRQDDLARLTSLSAATIRAFENGGVMRKSNQHLLLVTFRTAGVEFAQDEHGRQRITFDPAGA